MQTLDLRAVRRLALARAGLLPERWSGLPQRAAAGDGPAARAAAHAVIERFGYLQLDTISAAGARSHVLVLLSRLDGMDPALGERLLVPGAPLFEYWGHAASWMPLDLHPVFEFRREGFRRHPTVGEVLRTRRATADDLLRRARDEGGFRSVDLEGDGSKGWWRGKEAKRVAEALWSAGELAIRERRAFQRTYDLPERVLPADVRARRVPVDEAFRTLVLRALDGHGWADRRTIAETFHVRTTRPEIAAALRDLEDAGEIVPCALRADDGGGATPGWIRPRDLDLAGRLARLRPRDDRGVLLSPFDPLLWDRARVRRLFGFDVVLEIYKRPEHRRFGYFCMPVLAGERLVGRVDVRADRAAGALRTPAVHFEARRPSAADRAAVASAVARHAAALGLTAQP